VNDDRIRDKLVLVSSYKGRKNVKKIKELVTIFP
jgi:hypothetical protein